jgi:DNA-binding response OmpR family regulator
MGKPRVLLVDDDPDLVGLVKFRLARDGYETEHCADGAAAIDLMQKGDVPDLVICDVMMPYRNGFEVLSELRRNERWKDVPVIMLTARQSEKDVLAGIRHGADEYLAKPFRPAELMARVEKLLRKKAP